MFNIGFITGVNERDLKIAQKVGIDAVEVVPWPPGACERKEEIIRLLKEHGIKAAAVNVSMELDMPTIKSEIDFAAKVGSPVYIGHPEALTHGEHDRIKAFREYWTEACKYAEDKGIKVCVNSCGLNPESWDIIFHEVPELYLKYDPSFSNQEGRDIPMELTRYGSRLAHFHVKDEVPRKSYDSNLIKKYEYAPAGMGSIHWGQVVTLLYEVGYKGVLSVEVHSAFWNSDANFERGLVLAKRHLEQFMY